MGCAFVFKKNKKIFFILAMYKKMTKSDYHEYAECKDAEIIINAGNTGVTPSVGVGAKVGVPLALAGLALGAILIGTITLNKENTVSDTGIARASDSLIDNDVIRRKFKCDQSIATPVNVCNNICLYQKDNDGDFAGTTESIGSGNLDASVQDNVTGSHGMSSAGADMTSQGPAGQGTYGIGNGALAENPSGSAMTGNDSQFNSTNQFGEMGAEANQTNVDAELDVTTS